MKIRGGEILALQILEEITKNGAYFGLALQSVFAQKQPEAKERAAAMAYSKLVLENNGAVDYALSQVTKLQKCGRTVKNILRLGAARLMYGHDPDGVVVHACVELAEYAGKGAQKHYVNAVLRAFARQKEQIPWPSFAEDPLRYLSVYYSWPPVAVEQALAVLGTEGAQAFLSYRTPLPASVRIQPQKTNRAELAALFEQSCAGVSFSSVDPRGLLIQTTQDLTALPAYQQGLFSLQGEASMLAAQQAFAPGLILDVCAAPGGKSCNIAEMCPDSQIIALDLHPHRVALIRAQATRLGLSNIQPLARDATLALPEYRGKASAVLVDAPCSGFGTALHRPDIKRQQTAGDIDALAQIQSSILNNASACVQQGGKLIYCTCTFTQQENEEVLAAFLQSHPGFRLISPVCPPGFANTIQNGMLRVWPHLHHMDAFAIAVMEKTSE